MAHVLLRALQRCRAVHAALLFLPGMVFVLISAASVRAADSPLRIGEINPLSGKLAKHGMEIHEGILFAVEEVNARGGIKGHPVELISRDDQSQPEVAINRAEELLYREKVIGLVGGYVDSLVGPISMLAEKHHVPYVASASLQRNLTQGRENPFFFRVARLDGIIDPLCRFLARAVRPKRVAVAFTATPGSTEFAQGIRSCLETAGIHIPIFEKFRPGTPDFSSFLLKVRNSGAEVLVSGGFFPDHLIMVRQLLEQNIPLKAYLGPWGIAYPSFIEEMGNASENLLGMCAWDPAITLPGTENASKAFVNGFLKRFNKLPNTTTMHGYTSARALLGAMDQALQKGGTLSGQTICEQLRSLDLLLPMERLEFDKNGDPKHYHQVVVQIQKGRAVAVFPPEHATGKLITGGGT